MYEFYAKRLDRRNCILKKHLFLPTQTAKKHLFLLVPICWVINNKKTLYQGANHCGALDRIRTGDLLRDREA